jgi:hypothetical protein
MQRRRSSGTYFFLLFARWPLKWSNELMYIMLIRLLPNATMTKLIYGAKSLISLFGRATDSVSVFILPVFGPFISNPTPTRAASTASDVVVTRIELHRFVLTGFFSH